MTTEQTTFSQSAPNIKGAVQAHAIEQVHQHFYGPEPPMTKPAAPAQTTYDFGPLLAKLCDREIEDREFWDFFFNTCRECPNHPQFYIIPGASDCCHRSLLERFQQDRIKPYLKTTFGKTNTPHLVSVPLPFEGQLKIRQDSLAEGLLRAFDPDYAKADYTLPRLCEILAAGDYHQYGVIFVAHDVRVSKWDTHTQALLEWYLKTYWAGFECRAEFPLLLIFFNIIFPAAEKKPFWRRTTARQRALEWLTRFQAAVKGECQCLLFPELRDIERAHVEQFFSRHRIAVNDMEQQKWIEAVFNGKDRISMMEMEARLQSLLKEIGDRASGLHNP